MLSTFLIIYFHFTLPQLNKRLTELPTEEPAYLFLLIFTKLTFMNNIQRANWVKLLIKQGTDGGFFKTIEILAIAEAVK